jgi:hypothetical protein
MNTILKSFLKLGSGALMFLAFDPIALGQESQDLAVVPDGATTKPAEGSVTVFEGIGGGRYMNFYNGSEFTHLQNGGFITGLFFRLNETQTIGRNVTIPRIEIRMSTSPASVPDNIFPTFSQNVGADETIVYNGAMHVDAQASTSPLIFAVGTIIIFRRFGICHQ